MKSQLDLYAQQIPALKALHNTQRGAVVILGNGPSLLHHSLGQIPCPTIGTNQSWKVIDSQYHHTLEFIHYLNDPEKYEQLASEGKLIVGGADWIQPWPIGLSIPLRTPTDQDPVTFSIDLTKGIICSPIPSLCVGTVVYSALQLAVWLGFRHIYLIGVDLSGPKFTGEEAGDTFGTLIKMDLLFYEAKKTLDKMGVKVEVIGLQSRVTAFPKIPFPW